MSPPGQTRQLGEVIVSYPQAERQAQEQGHAVKQEIALLVIHGVLHLLGYDHIEDSDADAMRAKEVKLMGRVKL